MLGISTSTFTVVYFQVISVPAPIVEISGMMDENSVVLMHRGGESLDLDTKLSFNVGGKNRELYSSRSVRK
jgi:hypothetical protein